MSVPIKFRDKMAALGATHIAHDKEAPVIAYYVFQRASVWHDIGYSFGENQYCQHVHDTPRAWHPGTIDAYNLEPIR